MISTKKKTLIKIIWKASKADLFTALPWFPLYSFSEVFLAICAGSLIQLIFISSPIIELSDLAPGKFKSFMPYGISFSRSDIVFLLPVIMVCLGFIKLISRFLSTYLTERAGHRTSYQMRQEMLSAFLSATGNKIDSVNIDQFSNQLIQDTALLQDAINKGTISAIRDFLVLISIIISMLIISWKAFFIGIAIIIPCITGLRFVSQKLNYYTREGQKRQINLSTRILQSHAGVFVVHALRSQKREHHDLESLNSENYKFLHKSLFIRTIFSPVTEFFAICVLLAIFVWRVNYTGNIQASGYSSMLILVVFSFRYIKNISSTITFFSDVRVVITRIVNSLHEFTNRNNKNLLTELPDYSKEAIIAENISYEINGKKIITDCSISIVKGSKIAFIGESGAGKSSFLRILCGLLEPTKGKVSIQHNFLLSLQTPYIYKGNVQENIIYNNKDKYKHLDTEKCKDLISALGLSYSDTGTQIFLNKNLGFLGDGLSGGEKARVALSRILFADPKIILLDEPTANLDPKSSELFWNAIDKWHAQDSEHTVIAVSHLIKEISHFDLCYIFKDGKISEQIHPKAYLKRV